MKFHVQFLMYGQHVPSWPASCLRPPKLWWSTRNHCIDALTIFKLFLLHIFAMWENEIMESIIYSLKCEDGTCWMNVAYQMRTGSAPHLNCPDGHHLRNLPGLAGILMSTVNKSPRSSVSGLPGGPPPVLKHSLRATAFIFFNCIFKCFSRGS